MKPIQSAILLSILVLAPCLAAASSEEPGILVSAEWVHSRLEAGDPALVLIHIGVDESYAAEHIPGAHHLEARDMADPASTHSGGHDPNTLMLQLPEAEALQAVLRRIGVRETSRIVVYWSDERVTAASRAVFTLDWAGLGDRASLLDGGLPAWKAAGFDVTREVTGEPEPGDVVLRPRPEMIVDAEWVQAHLPTDGYQLVDARASAFFDGVREDRGLAGHIAGAGSIPWTSLLDEETMRLHPPEKLRELLSAAGVSPGDTVVGYCHIGLFTTLALLSSRLLGHEVLLYDGSFEDWAGRDLPAVSSR